MQDELNTNTPTGGCEISSFTSISDGFIETNNFSGITCGECDNFSSTHLDENPVLAGINKKCAHMFDLEI